MDLRRKGIYMNIELNRELLKALSEIANVLSVMDEDSKYEKEIKKVSQQLEVIKSIVDTNDTPLDVETFDDFTNSILDSIRE